MEARAKLLKPEAAGSFSLIAAEISFFASIFQHGWSRALLLTVGALLLTVPLRSTSMDCKQRSSTVSKQAPTVSKRTSHHRFFRGQKLNPNIFFSNFSGASGISRQNPGISRQKSLIPWVSRHIPNFLAPTPSRGRPPPHQKISGLKSLGLGYFFGPSLFDGPGEKE